MVYKITRVLVDSTSSILSQYKYTKRQDYYFEKYTRQVCRQVIGDTSFP